MIYKDQTVLITGASSGIGAEFATQFHALGAKVILVARRKEKLTLLVERLNKIRPSSAEALAVDLTTDNARAVDGQNSICLGVFGLVDYIQKNRIDILVNNAGRGSFGYFEEISITDELEMVALNINATMRLAHAVIPQMKSRKSGAIISLASIAALQPMPYMASYAATKAFNLTHSMGLRHELGPFGIRVLTVCPGPVATEFGGVAQVPGEMADFHRDNAADVVAESLRALARNQAIVLPCMYPKLLALAVRLSPKNLATYITGRMLKGSLKRHAKG